MNNIQRGKSPLHTVRYFILTVLILCADQLSKWFVVSRIPQGTIAWRWLDDVVWIVHVRNKAIAFSMGQGLPDAVKTIFFIIGPLVILVFLGVWIVRKGTLFSSFQKWVIAGIIGGGVGNLTDRIFRPDGVVDFISVYFPFFGFQRWPTFNIADSSVVVCGILLFISLIGSKADNTSTAVPSRTERSGGEAGTPVIFTEGPENRTPGKQVPESQEKEEGGGDS